MPTITTISLENLLAQGGVRDSLKKPIHGDPEEHENRGNDGPRHLYISPALYETPEQAPIPEHAASISPSPYVVNHKRRRGGTERRSGVPELPSGKEGDGMSLEEEEVGENFVSESLVGSDCVGEKDEGFRDLRSERESVGSEVEANELSRIQVESRTCASAQSEFFDAIDEFSSDGSVSSIPSYESRIESELHASKLSLLEEIERRKTAEETLVLMCSQWERMRDHLFEAGLTFPAPPAANDSMPLENNSLDKISEEVVVTRFVAEVVGRVQAHAEAEEAAAAIIESKDQDILRLRDRLQYYETVNHELSQRNLVEVARRQRERKRSRQRWIWSLVGLSVAIGTSFVAYHYIPSRTNECLSLLESNDSTDISSSSVSETSRG